MENQPTVKHLRLLFVNFPYPNVPEIFKGVTMEQVTNGIWSPNIPHGGMYSDEMRFWSHSLLPESHSHLETLFQGNILNVHKLVCHKLFIYRHLIEYFYKP